jgi:hypothetical protein
LKHEFLISSPFLITLNPLVNVIDMHHFFNNKFELCFLSIQSLVISLRLVIGEFDNLISHRFTIISNVWNESLFFCRHALVKRQLAGSCKDFW